MKHILYLPSWFPDRTRPLPGDFIMRHAESASLYNRITVFYTVVDKNIKQPEFDEKKINENFSIYMYYYPPSRGIIASVVSGMRRFSALRKMYKKVFRNSAPDLVHVHVAYPAGLFALYLRKQKGLKYILSEHDGIYMPGYDNHHIPGWFEKKIVPIIFKNAEAVHAVSKSLANALIRLKLVSDAPVVIPNVVNTDFFKYIKLQRKNIFQFIHVSSLTNQKNPEGMLAAISLVKKERSDFVLKIAGPVKEEIKKSASELSLGEQVVFLGEMLYADIASHISQSDAMIHFTRYETFGCVVAESLCCGVPVIVSDLEVTRELVTDGVNGLLVRENDVHDLAQKIIQFMKSGFDFKAYQTAHDAGEKFNYRQVGRMFDELYNSVLKNG